MQAALPEILLKTPTEFYDKIVNLFRESADKCYKLTNEIPGISCPIKPQGCMFLMVIIKCLWIKFLHLFKIKIFKYLHDDL